MKDNRFNLLGEFQYLAKDREPRDILLAKNIGLIAMLVLSSNHCCTRSKIRDTLWSDRCNEQASASLRHSLWSLRQVFGKDADRVLEADRKRVSLNMDNCSSDLDDFMVLSDSGCPEELERAVALYRGELLEGLSIRDREWEEWLGVERENLQSRYVNILCKLGNFYLADGNVTRIAEIGRSLVEHDPLCEDGHRFLMLGYAMMNQRSLALKQFERYSKTIFEEVEGQPGATIRNLYQYIRLGTAPGAGEQADLVSSNSNQPAVSAREDNVAAILKPTLASNF